jgi:hypothetical protein
MNRIAGLGHRQGMPIKRTEPIGKACKFLLVEVFLSDEGQDQIVEPEETKGRYLVIVKREDVDAVDLSADVAGHRTDVEQVGGTA